jgi:two-component system LytT family sensor kinase
LPFVSPARNVARVTERRQTARGWAIAVVAWTGLAGLSALQTALYLQQRGQPIAWGSLLLTRVLDWELCLAFAPVVLWLIRRSSLSSGRRFRLVASVLAAAVMFAPVKYTVLTPIMRWLDPARRSQTIADAVRVNFFTEILFLIGIAIAVYAVELYRAVQREQMERVRLGQELAEARLDALMIQLHPHFLFNTLNSVVSLIGRNPRAAEDMVTDLSGMLQETLRARGREVPLDDELNLLDVYLRIMRYRFGDRLVARIDVEPAARCALVPRFLLQPIVENAIEHGFNECHGGHVAITATARDSRLTIVIRDRGGGFPSVHDASAPGGGIGLANTRRRLDQMYGRESTLTITSDSGGTAVAMTLPYHTGGGTP